MIRPHEHFTRTSAFPLIGLCPDGSRVVKKGRNRVRFLANLTVPTCCIFCNPSSEFRCGHSAGPL